MDFNIHEEYMQRAIYLAKKGRGKVSPNPMVGCVIVKKGEIIGEGYHQIYGGDHAEVEALKNCKKDPSEASIYISLEPCCHYGKTAPCYNAIIDGGIRDIYISMVDPNPKVNGKSIKKLEEMNLNVQYDILNDKSEELNKGYVKWITTKMPLVIGKIAQDKNGFIAKKDSKIWITNETSKKDVHRLRSKVDAIMIGKNTALIDNPQLTVREVIGCNPKRIILDTNRTLPYSLKMLNDNESETIIICSNKKFQDNKTSHCKYLAVNEINGKLDPIHILQRLAEINITSIIIEGGAQTIKSFLDENLIDEFYLYTSPTANSKLDIKNPFSNSNQWKTSSKKFLDNDELIIFNKREKCLQES